MLMTDTLNHATAGGVPTTMDSNPLTIGILFLTASYYVVYCTGLLRWLRNAQKSGRVLHFRQQRPESASSTSL